MKINSMICFFFSSRRRHTRCLSDWSSDVCSSDLPNAPHGTPSDHGETCGSAGYIDWLLTLQRRGVEIGYHNATSHTSDRLRTEHGLHEFARLFGHYPATMSNHYFCQEGIYFTEHRLTG